MAPETVRVARHAMGTRFEILLLGDEKRSLRAAGEEALDEIERLDRQLSLFRPESELSRLNRRAAQAAVPVEPGLFRLLQTCRDLWESSGGLFDITVGPLMHCWGFRGERPSPPSDDELSAARAVVGMRHVLLDEQKRTIHFDRDGVALDLGAIAKGWALDNAADLLRETGVCHALLHGGTSTARALGESGEPDTAGWKIAIRPPPPDFLPAKEPWPDPFIRTILLRDEALSVSAVSGRFIARADRIDGHVLDPRRGTPVQGALLAAAVLPDATASDALSTALLAGGTPCQDALTASLPDLRSLLLTASTNHQDPKLHLESRGM